ncbi:hypothetical protein HN51_071226 [Arachis hypogaea]|uniref:S-protein homolog n=1 Tax=Arachis hypogaea TaxID=3818 RepID=A0A444YYX1_ARAHY|nr:uncharacterized protein DS421_15g518570 [Arachis hypogaea]RYR07133.1 hypothetical protein Ahy_B05g074456 [Arachis hypogaea]
MTISSLSLSKVVIMLIVVSFNLNISMSAETVYVTMVNKLNNTQLVIHCHDYNWDSKPQVAPIGQSWAFDFQYNPSSNYLFFCSFAWVEGGIFEVRRFNIYETGRDTDVCQDCVWSISEDGPCRISGDPGTECYEWEPKNV